MYIGKFPEFYVDVTKEATKIPQEQYHTMGRYPIIDQGQKSIAGMWDNPEGLYEKVPAIVFGDHTRAIKYVDTPFFIGADGVKVLRPVDEEDNVKYLFYVLQAARIPNLGYSRHFKAVKELEIRMYPRKKQDEIVRVLEQVDNLIGQRQNEIMQMDQLVKSRFVELFGSINNQSYPVVKIGSCAKLQGGFAFKSADYLDDGIRLVQISNVNKDTLDWDGINYVPQAFLQKYKDFELHVGDLVLAMTRPVIKSLDAVKIATVSENDVPSLLNQRVGRFVIDKTKLNSVYLMLSCQMPKFKEYVEAMSGNSLQPNISSKQVEEYSIVLPPLALQEEFAAFVSEVDKSKLAVKQSLEKLETLKKSLMQQYFG